MTTELSIAGTALTSRDLHEGWTVQALGGRSIPDAVRAASAIAATVPGTVHTDLLAAELIDDPYLDDNERLQTWIGSTSWRYRLEFDWHADAHERTDLVFEGLDTVATVSLNGTAILETRNQHRSHRAAVRELLVDGVNELIVDFEAPVRYADRMSLELGYRPHVNHHPYNAMRKMASSFGWDWGIDTSTSGIWRPVRLESWSTARISETRIVPTVDGGDGVVDVAVLLERTGDEPLRLELTVGGERAGIDVTGTEARLSVHLPEVELWWPRSHGAQPRYDLSVTVLSGETELDSAQRRIGFRTVGFDTTADADGTPFTLVVNGRRVAVRGVNWIPDDAFPHRVDRARYERRIRQAVEANINLIRVWGGGIYESEHFYDLCDELGVLSWQDFLLACAAYSEEEPLRSEIEAEAREAVARIGVHPSLVLFNGNNENLEGYEEWGWQGRLDGRTWGAGYYHELFPAIVAELAPHVPYTPGSPFSPGGVSRPNDPAHGSVHIWDTWNRLPSSAYLDYEPRFVAEFGWQGPPTWSTLTRSISDDPLTPESPGMQVHQKATDGNVKLTDGVREHFPLPQAMPDWHWAASLTQARAMRLAIGHFRSLGEHCGGTIVWQLNDDWPVTSWAAIDGDERPKPLYYALRQVYADRLVVLGEAARTPAGRAALADASPSAGGGGLTATLVNDTDERWTATLTVARHSFDGRVLASEQVEIDVAARETYTVLLGAEVSQPDDERSELLRAAVDGAAPAHRLWVADKDAALPDERFDVAVRDGHVEVTATTLLHDLALLADRAHPDARVDDMLVTLLPGETARFRVTGADVDQAALRTSVVTANGIVRRWAR